MYIPRAMNIKLMAPKWSAASYIIIRKRGDPIRSMRLGSLRSLSQGYPLNESRIPFLFLLPSPLHMVLIHIFLSYHLTTYL